MGPQGAGKGTQAARLAAHYGIPAISTGDIFRANIKGGTELGRLVQEYTAKGDLVPDSVTNDMVRDRLAQDDVARGFILDGYPATRPRSSSSTRSSTISGDAGRRRRAHGGPRRASRSPAQAGRDRGREDDTEEAIARRLDIYAEQTAPLTSAYAERGLLAQVDGIGEIDDVTSRLVEALAPLVG
ncbi:nucleoside monophosphate kinase [Oerskovia sp. M15]